MYFKLMALFILGYITTRFYDAMPTFSEWIITNQLDIIPIFISMILAIINMCFIFIRKDFSFIEYLKGTFSTFMTGTSLFVFGSSLAFFIYSTIPASFTVFIIGLYCLSLSVLIKTPLQKSPSRGYCLSLGVIIAVPFTNLPPLT